MLLQIFLWLFSGFFIGSIRIVRSIGFIRLNISICFLIKVSIVINLINIIILFVYSSWIIRFPIFRKNKRFIFISLYFYSWCEVFSYIIINCRPSMTIYIMSIITMYMYMRMCIIVVRRNKLIIIPPRIIMRNPIIIIKSTPIPEIRWTTYFIISIPIYFSCMWMIFIYRIISIMC